jgi:hypothetical protein
MAKLLVVIVGDTLNGEVELQSIQYGLMMLIVAGAPVLVFGLLLILG